MKTIGRVAVFFMASCLTLQIRHVYSGPFIKRSSRMIREVYPEIEPEKEGNLAQVCIVGDVVYEVDEPVPAEQPCLKCKCQPPGVQCETTRCVKKPGCKAIHRPNKCCPDYQCECEHEGRTYANGERLESTPGGECKVCYCRGGEVQCADVSCYIRTDCEGRRVEGQCCLRYDNCPPKEPNYKQTDATEPTSLNQEKNLYTHWFTTYLSSNPSPPSYDAQNENTIQEFSTDKGTEMIENSGEMAKPTITIQEIIPERKEIPMIEQPKTVVSADLKADEKSDHFIDTETESSEVSHIYQQPPPVLRIGDKLLFLKKGDLVPEKDTSSPPSVITLIGAEGLQRGDSGEIHEVSMKRTENISGSHAESVNVDEKTHIISLVKKNRKKTNDVEITTVHSNYSTQENLVNSEPSDQTIDTDEVTVTENSSDEAITLSSEEEERGETTHYEDEITTVDAFTTTESYENRTESLENDTLVNEMTNLTTEVNILEINNSTEELPTYVNPVDENPAYPPIPDIMSPQIAEQTEHVESEALDNVNYISNETKILPDVLQMRDNKTIPQNTSHSEWLKNENNTAKTQVKMKTIIYYDVVNQSLVKDTNIELTTADNNNADSTTDVTVTTQISGLENATNEEVSKEIVEVVSAESGEATTNRNSHASIMSNENASVDVPQNNSPEFETAELVELMARDEANQNIAKDVELRDLPKAREALPSSADVEMFDPEILKRAVSSANKKQKLPERVIDKRQNMEDDFVFHQLEQELEASHEPQTDEDKEASDDVFKQLEKELEGSPKLQTNTEKGLKEEELATTVNPLHNKQALLARILEAINKGCKTRTSDAQILDVIKLYIRSLNSY